LEYPVLGKIKVAGLTLFQAKDSIQARAARYVADVVVGVRMLNFRFTVLGEVNGEQTVVSFNTRLTMMEAIGLSGGFGELADRSLVKVVRQNENTTEIYYLDLLKEEFIESPHYYVQQNDIINCATTEAAYFPKILGDKPWNHYGDTFLCRPYGNTFY
jgi:polysaccharide export outer membrane protein